MDRGADQRVLGGGRQEQPERRGERRPRILQMRVERALHRADEAVGLAQHERLRELIARAELLVERLPADARRGRDVRHRDVAPGALLELVAGGVEQRVAQQLAGGDRVGRARAHRGASSPAAAS